MLPIEEKKLSEANILEILNRALTDLYQFDKKLLDLRVKEECINHRLAVYIERYYPYVFSDDPYFSVDVEYNKAGVEKKGMPLGYNNVVKAIRPDIIMHLRGNDEGNIMAIEAKKGAISQHDINKLEGFLKPPFSYRFAIGLSYCKNPNYFVLNIMSRGKNMKELKINK